jgi:hypothetical protein
MAKPTQAPNNPFACPSNAVKMHTVGPCCGVLLAAFSYAVTDNGDTVTFTPLTGNTSADLKYYRWSVVDKNGEAVGVALDLNSPAAAVVANTAQLDKSGPFKVKFAACKQAGAEEAAIMYEIYIDDVTSNPSGTSTPSNYENVSFVLKLTSTDDGDFTEFPADGLEIKAGDVVSLVDFLATDSQLNNAGSYVFSLEASKCWYEPTADEPTNPSGDVIASAVAEPSYPIALSNAPVQIWGTITIATGVAGQFSEVVTVDLNGEDVQPSVSFTLKTDVA